MGVYIQCLNVPSNCLSCRFLEVSPTYGDFCVLKKKTVENVNDKLKNCPLVDVPPHGRLIDADALTNNILLRTYIRFHTGETPPSEWMILGQHIINAPTILEAEVEE